jgi:hypothetical protein
MLSPAIAPPPDERAQNRGSCGSYQQLPHSDRQPAREIAGMCKLMLDA